MRSAPILAMAVAVIVAACGGGGGGGGETEAAANPPPAVAGTGQFKDGNVAGLAYRTATRSGVTDASGRFEYQAGETVSFAVGGVTLGSATARPVVTPLDLVPGSRSDAAAVLNVVRFLMMLDADGDAGNGIGISAAVRAAAAAWGPVDFAAADLAAALGTRMADVAAADGRLPTLPDAMLARTHLEGTLYCTMSGVYVGTFGGTRSGRVIVMIDPADGSVRLHMEPLDLRLEGPGNEAIDSARSFELERTSDGVRVAGGLTDGVLSGSWRVGTESGTFSATALFQDTTAAYRFSGTWWYADQAGGDLRHYSVYEVDADGNLRGRFGSRVDGDQGVASGTLLGNTMRWGTNTNATGTGTLNPSTLVVTGSWSGTSNRGGFLVRGCRLN